ncbi:hypothetical protein ACTJJ0_09240 [Chitinophaga sp. 22321]|uniref:Uncharacterized protein n=1 Tax=Chitinophaga hostae TaxID=2831022 RepID=A0ABS5ITN0_9BACT|nr:hypothetical protein [Chitinophaga hostae]MBS0025727.1 hypothetical protein [Chitinophaga hostae]
MRIGVFGTIVLILGIVLIGLYAVEIPTYREIEIIAEGNHYYMMSRVELKENESIQVVGSETSYTINASITRLSTYKYELLQMTLPDTVKANLKKQYITRGRILTGKTGLLNGIMNF